MWRPLAISLALLFITRAASASENYPEAIRATVPTGQPLPCTLCHEASDGGDGAVTTAFGREMLDFGMKGGDPASLVRALRRNAAQNWDSDGDGVPDIEELVFGTDPSTRALTSGPPLEHGCAIHAIGARASGSGRSLALFALIASRLSRRRYEK